MAVITVTEENYDQIVLQNNGMILADFYAGWCGPCKALAPIIEQIAEEEPALTVCKINIDQSRALADKMGILSVPTLMLIKNKAVVHTIIGLHSKAEILQQLHAYC